MMGDMFCWLFFVVVVCLVLFVFFEKESGELLK